MIKTNTIKATILFLSVIFISSCFNEKKIAYFQKDVNGGHDTINVSQLYVPTIQPGDILSIPISSLSLEASSFFNPFSASASTSGDASTSGSTSGSSSDLASGAITAPALSQSASSGYLVDPSGNIELPLIGKLHISGKTTVQTQDTIKNLLKTYLKEPTVLVRVLNYKISILGEVAKPAVYIIPNEMITVPEALSMAGDLTIFGRRDNVQVIRTVNGKKIFGYINLNSREVFNSPYYYLHADDILYIQPGKAKAEATDHTYVIIPSIVSLISIIVLFLKK